MGPSGVALIKARAAVDQTRLNASARLCGKTQFIKPPSFGSGLSEDRDK